jgi:tetratricopeptide (TPR) repeat protein
VLCSQCNAPAERCTRCAAALCTRRLCAELHEVSCEAVSALSVGAPIVAAPTAVVFTPRTRKRRERNTEAERAIAEHLVAQITRHRQAGRAALLTGDLDIAFDELWAARHLEPDLDRLGPSARLSVPRDWELETDLTPLARALSSRNHLRATDAWRRLLDDRPARSIQAEAAEWLARDAFGSGDRRVGLRLLHAASLLGRGTEPEAFHSAYKQAGIDPVTAFNQYLAASRVDPRTARALGLLDPLTGAQWTDQDPRWWALASRHSPPLETTDHQFESLNRARDLNHSKRDQGWLLLAEGDHAAGPLGVRTLGRNVRAGCADAHDEDAFVRIRLAYEGAADRLPDVAWPWYRLAELLAWAGFNERALDHYAQAERLSLGSRDAVRTSRPLLRALVQAGLGTGPDGLPTAARPFPAEPYGGQFTWRWRLW